MSQSSPLRSAPIAIRRRGSIASLARAGAITALLTDEVDELVLTQALRHASRCAAINITREGCQPPTWDEVVGAGARG